MVEDGANLKYRKIGLGIMGFADLCLLMHIRYGSKDSILLAEKIMKFLKEQSHQASAKLTEERPSYLGYRKGMPKRRNLCLTTIAPTGTLSQIAGCNFGIEPFMAEVTRRKIIGIGDVIIIMIEHI